MTNYWRCCRQLGVQIGGGHGRGSEPGIQSMVNIPHWQLSILTVWCSLDPHSGVVSSLAVWMPHWTCGGWSGIISVHVWPSESSVGSPWSKGRRSVRQAHDVANERTSCTSNLIGCYWNRLVWNTEGVSNRQNGKMVNMNWETSLELYKKVVEDVF